MRVLHLFKTYLPDSFAGVERVIWNIAEGTAPLGVESTVLSLSRNHRPGPQAVGHHLARTAKLDLYLASTGLSISVFPEFARLASQSDVIHYHFPWPMMDLLHLYANGSKPSVVTYHSDIVRQRTLAALYRPLMLHFLGEADRLVATSPNYLASSPVLQRFAAKTSVIPIGIAETEYPPTANDLQRWRRRVPERFFLFVGALRYYKGLPYLIEAAKLSGLPVVVAGAGEMASELQQLNLDNVTLVGEVSEIDKNALLTLCTVFVFPSHLRSEAFGVSLAEAARAGKPMISCEIGTGTTYVNINNETGLTVLPADAAALASAMRRLWADDEKAAVMGQRARARYESLFAAKAMSASYRALYEEVIEAKNRRK